MLVDSEVFENLNKIIKKEKIEKAKKYQLSNKVKLKNIKYEDDKNFSLTSLVEGTEKYTSKVEISNSQIHEYSCTCLDYINSNNLCKHIAATIYELELNKKYESSLNLSNKLNKKEKNQEKNDEDLKYYNSNKLINKFKENIFEESETISNINEDINDYLDENNITVSLIPRIDYMEKDKLRLSFQLSDGTNSNKIRDLFEFADNIENKKVTKYGTKIELKNDIENFDDDSKLLVKFILNYIKGIKRTKELIETNNSYYFPFPKVAVSYISLQNNILDDFIKLMIGKNITYKEYNMAVPMELTVIKDYIKLFKFDKTIDGDYRVDILNAKSNFNVIKSKTKFYFIDYVNNNLIISKRDIKLEELYNNFETNNVVFGVKNINEFFTIIYPKIYKYLEIDKEKFKDLLPKELAVKIYLDLNENKDIVLKLEFCYGDKCFNPLEENNLNIVRNLNEENNIYDIITKCGFVKNVEFGYYMLFDDDKIYEFLSDKINYFMEKFEVLISERFKTKQIKQPKIGTLGIKLESNLLSLDFKDIDFDLSEFKEIMKLYSLKTKYYKLKDGSYLNLEDNEDLNVMNDLITSFDLEYKDIFNGNVRIPMHRSLYLERLLNNSKSINVVKSENYRNIIDDIENSKELDIKVPNELDKILREYQKSGFKWLKTLDSYGFGGILADDMGLGKTLQIIAFLLSYIEENKKHKPSLVVCPSSLSLNWKNEILKFAKNIKVLVISGSKEERKEKIESISKYDLAISSYDLLKRDRDLYSDIEFKYIFADEAQYIKNSNTLASKAIKSINSENRFALTGTPMENSLSELWSIFDYIMPGYLYTYNKFKKNFETLIVKNNDERAMRKLKAFIKPFILRRNKKEVLTELPEKTITVLTNEMDEMQRKIYLLHLAKAKEELEEEMSNNSFEKSKIKILALLNRLRQICCHPSLFLDNYDGESSKLEQCMEIINEAVAGKHKILLFSSYTSVFEILEERFKENNINYFKLTGKTKVLDRVNLVDEFNKNEDVSVFLISLKAGGTGLNLTAADMVIHFDPWWNLSAENQATDRAYRIGQKNNVQVYKLITKDSIEEKIFELQQTKAKLIDDMLNSEATFINKLSKEDIINLFK